jgi:hypothetical protein
MLVPVIERSLIIAAAAAACYALAERFGTLAAGLIWAAAAACACGAGTALLATSALGRVTWRNRVAGYLIPWGWRLNRGRLWPVPIISWAVWVAVGAAALVLRPGPADDEPGVGPRIALFAAWVADAAALLYVAGTIRQATPGGRVRSLWELAAVIALVIAGSVVLYLSGLPTAALLVGGGPPAVLGGCAAVVVLLVVTLGRNARWN